MSCARIKSKNLSGSDKPRTSSGSTLVLLALGILLSVFALGILALDIAHNCTTRTSLQNAADASALAGASMLVYGNVQDTVPPPVANQAQTTATDRAATNTSDGRQVCAKEGVTLNGNALPWILGPSPGNGITSNNGQCQVGADLYIRNMFAGLVGHPTDKVSVQSIATAYTSLTGVDQNVAFPIAVSLDTINGHDPKDATNKPLNQCNLGDPFMLYMKEPCANASWTTFNTGKDKGANASALDAAAVAYINEAIASALGTKYEEGLIPAQYVGEQSASGATGKDGGINLLGDISNTSDLSKILIGKTIVLPVVAGDLPYWSQDAQNSGTQFAPGAGQTRPLIGFIGLKVTKVTNDGADNALQSIKGVLVKALVKGVPGQARPNIDATADPSENYQALDVKALINLSPGLVQLGATNLLSITAPTPDLSSWYHGHSPPDANTISDPGMNNPAPICATLRTIINNDLATIPANEGWNFSKPPDVAGAIAVIPSSNQATDPVDTILVNPDADLVITAHFQDEVGLNKGTYVTGYGTTGGRDPICSPRYKILDSTGAVVQDWTPISVGPAAQPTDPYSLTIKVPGKSLPVGEHLIMIHTYDIDLGYGGSQTPNAAGPHYGDPAYYYLDLQNPACDLSH